MSWAKLNELLDRALREMHQEGLSVVTYREMRPWLPESYWAQVEAEGARATAQRLLDLAEHAKMVAKHRRYEDAHLAEQDAATIIAEWDDKLPALQGPDERMKRAGWGRDRMRDLTWHRSPVPPVPTDKMQPSYDFECCQCGRPITNARGDRWTDHGGKTVCDLAFVDPIDVETECYWTDHTPKPWHGEEEDE